MDHKNPSMRRPRDPNEAERKKESILDRSWSFPSHNFTKRKESIEVFPQEKSIEIEHDASCRTDFASASVQHGSPGHNETHDAPPRRDGSKIEVLELIILLANFIVELMSTAFDQLSSKHKPFLLPCLIMSILAVLINIWELVYKLIKEMDFWEGVPNWGSWLFDPPRGVRVGFFPCIIALTCAFGQFIITTVNYFLYRNDGNAPIKVSIWSTVFAFGQLFSSLSSRVAKTETKTETQTQTEPELTPAPELEPELTPAPEPEPKPKFESEPTPELLPELKPKPEFEPEFEPAFMLESAPPAKPASPPKIRFYSAFGFRRTPQSLLLVHKDGYKPEAKRD